MLSQNSLEKLSERLVQRTQELNLFMIKKLAEQIKRIADERVERYVLRKYGLNIRRNLTDAIKLALNPPPNQSYIYGIYTNIL